MVAVAENVTMIDTLLGGEEGITAAFLVAGESPALIDPGAETSADATAAGVAAAGLAPEDLAWIVLTHIHLDHCGATGRLVPRFPNARVVVHPRGARHLVEPERLVAGTAAVHGPALAPLYGGLDAVPAERVISAPDGHQVPLGGGRHLRMLESPGHARHHHAILLEDCGFVVAGDAAGARLPGSGQHPVLPPPETDVTAARASVARIADLEPQAVAVTHFGLLDDPVAGLARADEQIATLGEAAQAAARAGAGDAEAIGREVDRALPLEATVGDPTMVERWRRLEWRRHCALGLEGWLSRTERTGEAAR